METVRKNVTHNRVVFHGVSKTMIKSEFINDLGEVIGCVMENYTNPTIRINDVVYKVKE